MTTPTAALPADQSPDSDPRNTLYLATWRWHFYAGIYVIPFLIMLPLTGLVMLHRNTIEAVQYRELLFVAPSWQPASAEAQVEAVRRAYPEATLTQYIPPPAADRSSQISVKTPAEQILTVFVNPAGPAILGSVDQSTTWYSIASLMHGTFFLGDFGDRLIEIAAGLVTLLVITGIYLWWPRGQQGLYASLRPRTRAGRRVLWRDLHSTVGAFIALGLLFFTISGLSWTGIWGEQLVQAWNSFPAEKTDAPLSHRNHESLNHGAHKEVPWNLEQTPLPASGSMAGADGIPAGVPIGLDSVIAYARDNGFTRFRVSLPVDEAGVYTVSANTTSGDIADPRQDRTVHLDRYTGRKLADITFDDYSPMAKAMAAGIALHQGDVGLWNTVLNTVFCLAVLFLAGSGLVMWWLRRPKGVFRLAAPPMPRNLPLWKGAVAILVVVAVVFPLVGLTLLGVLALDLLVLSRIPALKRVFE